MNYEEALEFIHGTLKFGSKLGLENIKELLARLGNPHKTFKSIHIAGTNGKGSVTAMTANILHQAGYKIGIFISPYLERFTERIQVNFTEIPKEDLARLTGIVKEKIRRMVDDGFNHPTEFEVVTALGFLYFAEQNIDFAVVEVGLGGRLDATNVIEPLVSVITSISYDHCDILGYTLKEIAYEKGGIIKEGVPIVSYPQEEEAEKVLKQLAAERHSPYHQVSLDSIIPSFSAFTEQYFDFVYRGRIYEDLVIHLPGKHQLVNSACALTCIMVLKELGYTIDSDAVYTGLEATKWPGRMEKVNDSPTVILDGAHNPSGAQVLAEAVKIYFPNKKVHIIMGIFKDKDVDKVVKTLCSIAHKVTATMSKDSPRAMDALELSKAASKYHNDVSVEPDLKDAIMNIMDGLGQDDVLIVSGSLHLIGEARTIILNL